MNVNESINFLTRPLLSSYAPNTLSTLRSVLHTTLSTAYAAASNSGVLTLSFSTYTLPPRPVYAACIASNVLWADWMNLLGGRDFDMTIRPRSVFVAYFGSTVQHTLVWVQPSLPPTTTTTTIIRPQQQLRGTKPRHRTLAQQLLETNDKEETEELFSMISGIGSMDEDAYDERPSVQVVPVLDSMHPSSRAGSPFSSSSSTSSDSGSWSGFGSEEDEYTSPSSIGSDSSPVRVDSARQPRPFPNCRFPTQQQQQRLVQTPKSVVPSAPFAGAPPQKKKKDVTKYLYQGGVSTTLTGGVMLGKRSPPSPSSSISSSPPFPSTSYHHGSVIPPPRYRAPIQNQPAMTRMMMTPNHVVRPTSQAPSMWHKRAVVGPTLSRFN